MLYVNYFDLKESAAAETARELDARAVIDDTQAFFRRGRAGAWSFNSARKFFGVPDGAYMYGPLAARIRPAGANESAPADHLTTRLAGDQQRAYQQYVDAESKVSAEVLAPSSMTTRLLAGVPYEQARAARRQNFVALHERLGGRNKLTLPMSLDRDAAPFCYPFLPAGRALHEDLWKREIFVPRLWPEVATRGAAGFEWERALASRLLPLPVDHRYGHEEMTRVSDAVLEAAA